MWISPIFIKLIFLLLKKLPIIRSFLLNTLHNEHYAKFIILLRRFNKMINLKQFFRVLEEKEKSIYLFNGFKYNYRYP